MKSNIHQNTQGVFPNGYTLGKNRTGVYKPELASVAETLYRSHKITDR